MIASLNYWDTAMIRVYAEVIATVGGCIEGLRTKLRTETGKVPAGRRKVIAELCRQCAMHAGTLSLSMTEKAFGRVAQEMDSGSDFSVADVEQRMNDITNRLRDELALHCFFQISAKEYDLYSGGAECLGKTVAEAFPSLSYDIAEMGKCLALGRSTAAAFHALRCLEGGFAAIWRSLSIADPIKGYERNWANRIKKVEDALEAKWPKANGRNNEAAKFYEQAVGALHGMQNPYRNATMHLDQVYTEEDAAHIVELVRGFMQKTASRMDENGKMHKRKK